MKLLQGFVILTIGVLIGLLSQTLATSVQYPLGTAPERASPMERVTQNDVGVYQDKVVINVKDAQWATFANTNSMDPVFDQGSYAIQVTPKSMDDIQVGDIVSYTLDNRVIIHRVIEKNIDGNGWYLIVKGDNNPNADPQKVRFEQVTRVVIGIIY